MRIVCVVEVLCYVQFDNYLVIFFFNHRILYQIIPSKLKAPALEKKKRRRRLRITYKPFDLSIHSLWPVMSDTRCLCLVSFQRLSGPCLQITVLTHPKRCGHALSPFSGLKSGVCWTFFFFNNKKYAQ